MKTRRYPNITKTFRHTTTLTTIRGYKLADVTANIAEAQKKADAYYGADGCKYPLEEKLKGKLEEVWYWMSHEAAATLEQHLAKKAEAAEKPKEAAA